MFFGFPLKNPIQRWKVHEIGAFLPRQGQGKRHFSTQILVEIRGTCRIRFGLVLSCRIVHSEDGNAEINCAEAGARVAPICAFWVVFDEKNRARAQLLKKFCTKKVQKSPWRPSGGCIFFQIVKNPFFLFGFWRNVYQTNGLTGSCLSVSSDFLDDCTKKSYDWKTRVPSRV